MEVEPTWQICVTQVEEINETPLNMKMGSEPQKKKIKQYILSN
jgi:hypothetical protein